MKYKYMSVITGAFILLLLLFAGCEGPSQPTFGPGNPDPNPSGSTPAALNTISPQEGYLKDIVTITGSGFNTNPEYTLVAFGKQTGKVIAATANEIQVQAPNISSDTVKVKVAIKGSEFWSNELEFVFKNTIDIIDEEIVWPNGVDVDNNDNIYIGSAADSTIFKITPDGEKSVFAAVHVSGAIRFGPNGYLYVCQNHHGKIVRVSPDGSVIEDVVETDSPVCFDWDENDNLYIVNNGVGISRLTPGGEPELVAELTDPKVCRVFGNQLFVSDIWSGIIWRYDITPDGLTNKEQIFEGDSPLGIEFDKDGTMYYTLAWETSLFTLNSDGVEETLYDGQLMTPMHYITFGKKFMYIVYPGWGDVGEVMRVYIGVEGAPNYGRE
ncbi:MAG TPA: IPT/TIG domain-containing protein [bacterium]|nr:IPT/TIG domain-containing protein [bacterium]HPN43577.1 IPT/TIG domain-containing protein [bacterium]